MAKTNSLGQTGENINTQEICTWETCKIMQGHEKVPKMKKAQHNRPAPETLSTEDPQTKLVHSIPCDPFVVATNSKCYKPLNVWNLWLLEASLATCLLWVDQNIKSSNVAKINEDAQLLTKQCWCALLPFVLFWFRFWMSLVNQWILPTRTRHPRRTVGAGPAVREGSLRKTERQTRPECSATFLLTSANLKNV